MRIVDLGHAACVDAPAYFTDGRVLSQMSSVFGAWLQHRLLLRRHVGIPLKVDDSGR